MRFGKILSAAHFGICLGKDVRKVTQTISPQKKKKNLQCCKQENQTKTQPGKQTKKKKCFQSKDAGLFILLSPKSLSFIVKGKTPLQKHSNSTGIHKQLAFSITYTRRETSHKYVQSRKALSFSQITIKITEHRKMSRNKVHDTKRSIQTFVKLLLFITLEVNSKKKKSKGINKSQKLFHAVIKFPNI